MVQAEGVAAVKAMGSITGPRVSELEEAERKLDVTGLYLDFPDPSSFDCMPLGN